MGRLGDRVGLLQQRRRLGVLPGVHVHAGAVAGRDGKDAERACLARAAHAAGGQLVPDLVLPEIRGDAARQPEPAVVGRTVPVVSSEGVERLPQRSHGCRVTLRDPRR